MRVMKIITKVIVSQSRVKHSLHEHDVGCVLKVKIVLDSPPREEGVSNGMGEFPSTVESCWSARYKSKGAAGAQLSLGTRWI